MFSQLLDDVFQLLMSERVETALVASRPQTDEPAPVIEEKTSSPPWVLHIEDDDDFSTAIKLRLEAYGVAVVRAGTGVQGYTTAFLRGADAILLDYEMPGAEGDYVLRRLKDNPVTQDIPVIVISGRHDRALARQMLNLGAERYLTKPVEFQELLSELRRHIDILPVACEQLAV